jgi:hypothetical protein
VRGDTTGGDTWFSLASNPRVNSRGCGSQAAERMMRAEASLLEQAVSGAGSVLSSEADVPYLPNGHPAT